MEGSTECKNGKGRMKHTRSRSPESVKATGIPELPSSVGGLCGPRRLSCVLTRWHAEVSKSLRQLGVQLNKCETGPLISCSW